ncbi:hypothetical protein [Lewinella sp. 4G2]|uniref:hypothetical protein n=1 Tax=Lewinella sp. 4G2 TaxID=1803372 RepID=UPI0012FA30CD|nr:hypothetical protein [Lewinella sp. 4G2]
MLLFSGACHQPKSYSSQMNPRFEAYEARLTELETSLASEFDIDILEFDVECIYNIENLSQLVIDMLELGDFKFDTIKSGHNTTERFYYYTIKISDKQYEFRTSSRTDWVDLDYIMPVLESIVENHKRTYMYAFSNIDGGQIARLVFSEKEKLALAVDRGFPCSLPHSHFKVNIDWPHGLYSEVKYHEIPNMDELTDEFHKELKYMYNIGLDVPNLNRERIFIGSKYEDDLIEIFIDGGYVSSSTNKISEDHIQCFWNVSGIILANTLVKNYGYTVRLLDKTTGEYKYLSNVEYANKVQKAIGRRN